MKRGFSVTDVRREKKIGVAAAGIEELIQKSCDKLGVNVECSECCMYVAKDGTQVDDDEYLATLSSDTLFVLMKKEEIMVTDFGHYYKLLRLQENYTLIDIGEDAEKFVIANIKEIVKIFNRFHAFANDSKTMLSERSQDPDWFEGLHPSNENKEEVMSRRAKDRMENYLNVTKNKLQKSDLYKDSRNKLGKILIDRFVEDLKRLLVSKKYNMSYFNRKAREDARLCHENGVFECGGLWNNEKCSYEGEHITNPYRSYRERVGFKCWQLDHNIELSRSIIPKIMEAVKALYMGDFRCIICNKGTNPGGVEPDRYYKQIFTRENLKLVHVECHNTQKRPNNHSGVFTVCKNCFGGQNIQ